MLTVLVILIIHWYASLFCQSFFLHRYCSHKMFQLNRFWESFFYLFTYISQGASFLNPYSYARLHTDHHQFSDTEKDPHSPLFSGNIFTMMIKTFHRYAAQIKIARELVKTSDDPYFFGYGQRLLKKIDALGRSRWNILIWLFIYAGLYFVAKVPLYLFPFIVFHMLMGPMQGAIVNWFGHKYGYRNYQLHDNSKNVLFIDLLLAGELYQNNHHQHAKKLHFAHRWFEVDLTYMVCKPLRWLRIIKY
jgi:stearoyl-CoA desaturase (delta-9 desaturase)